MWENLAIQIPIVAAFIWFVLEMDKRNAAYAARRDEQWRAFLAEQSKQSAEALNKATGAIEKISSKFDDHDNMVREAIAEMKIATYFRRQEESAMQKAQSDQAKRARNPRNL